MKKKRISVDKDNEEEEANEKQKSGFGFVKSMNRKRKETNELRAKTRNYNREWETWERKKERKWRDKNDNRTCSMTTKC